MKYIFVKGVAVPPIDDLATVMSQCSAEERLGLARGTAKIFIRDVEQLKAAGLWADVEEDEKTFLQAGIDEVSPQQQIDASWLAESIVCLLWALRILPELPSYDQEASHELLKKLPATSIKDLVKQARLRSKMEIEKQRDIAELWHWRARTRKLQEEGRLRGQVYGGQLSSRSSSSQPQRVRKTVTCLGQSDLTFRPWENPIATFRRKSSPC